MSPQLRRTPIALLSCAILAACGALAPAGVAAAEHRHAGRGLAEPPPEQTPGASEVGPSPTAPRPSEPAAGHENGCGVNIEASAERVAAGETVTLRGQLLCAEEASADGATIAILQRGRIDGVPTVSSLSATAGEGGSFEVTTPALSASSMFLARCTLARRGARVAVKVTPRVTLEGPAAAGAQLLTRPSGAGRGHRVFRFAGTVDPALGGIRVALQYQYGGGSDVWRTVAFGHAGEDGRYAFVHGFGSGGPVDVRVVAHPRGELAAASEPLSYEVVGPARRAGAALAAPTLTLAPPPATVAAGAEVAFSGTVAPAAPADASEPVAGTVELQRQNPDGIGFHVVASATTDGTGAYAIPYVFGHAGTVTLRIKVLGASGEVAVSAPFAIEVAPT
ncbi:MAG TPA: hypothetical protein VMG62_07945 [Solirubrobacteraceae bacterium]|nr:hypothetical protein [Solirubrobacteraceae bacterium]